MKQLLAGIVLLILLGVAGFLYRNEVERPLQNPSLITPGATGGAQACTDEAKVCPDGSAVGRTGPNCTFAVCPPPNAEIVTASTTIGFVLPTGYTQLEQGAAEQSTLRIYQKAIGTGSSATAHVITVSDYPIPAGGSGSAVILANTVFDPSGLTATSTSQLTQKTIGRNTFWVAQIGRFEGQVETAYYLVRPNDVVRFDLIERNVSDWTDPNLNVSALPEHESFVQMLGTLQIS